MSKAIADATDATEPVPMKGPFVLSPVSWVSSDSILIKYSATRVEQAARALCPRAGEAGGGMEERRLPSWNGEQVIGGEPWAGAGHSCCSAAG